MVLCLKGSEEFLCGLPCPLYILALLASCSDRPFPSRRCRSQKQDMHTVDWRPLAGGYNVKRGGDILS